MKEGYAMLKENIAISKATDTLIQFSWNTQKLKINKDKAQKILRDMKITGEIAGYDASCINNGVILIIVNPLSWTTPELGLEKLKNAFE